MNGQSASMERSKVRNALPAKHSAMAYLLGKFQEELRTGKRGTCAHAQLVRKQDTIGRVQLLRVYMLIHTQPDNDSLDEHFHQTSS